MGFTFCILRNYPVIEQTGDLSAIHHSNSLKKIILDIFKLNVRNGKNKLFLPTSHLFANLVARNAVQKQVLNPTRDTEDTRESHHCYQWTCHHHVCMYCEARRTPRVSVTPPTFTIQSDFQVILENFRNRKLYSPAGYVDYAPNRLEH